jgi:two-component system, NtrC family, nitrogen regulation sensor histidine kinase NtrY
MKTRLDAAEIIGDKDQLLRVFNNLIKNGIQAIPEGRHGKIIVELEKQNENYLISIIDNGSGIPEELREKIFNPNFTTKTTGMGLGLAMVKNIVTSHEGEITFDTKEGEGTCFVVKLKIPEA